jgi:hypothetical protein
MLSQSTYALNMMMMMMIRIERFKAEHNMYLKNKGECAIPAGTRPNQMRYSRPGCGPEAVDHNPVGSWTTLP